MNLFKNLLAPLLRFKYLLAPLLFSQNTASAVNGEHRRHVGLPGAGTLPAGAHHTGMHLPADERAWDTMLHILGRTSAINSAVHLTAGIERGAIQRVVDLFSTWMLAEELVCVLGAGRALLAGASPANRLAHAGPIVQHQGDRTPLRNTRYGGNILAVSTSGLTEAVLQDMRKARALNRDVTIVGFVAVGAEEFRQLCTHFVGIHIDLNLVNPLTALADTGEFVISLLLDSIVVRAAERIGIRGDLWRFYHENLGATGPYEPGDRVWLGPVHQA